MLIALVWPFDGRLGASAASQIFNLPPWQQDYVVRYFNLLTLSSLRSLIKSITHSVSVVEKPKI
jgi:hypothetical protein